MIGQAVEAALPVMRAHAESLMTSRCDIHRQATGWDEDEQKSVTTWAPVHLAVPCHVESPAATSRTLLADETATAETPAVRVSHTLTGIEPDDRVTVASGDVMWVTRAAPEDSTHPVEVVIQCRWVR